MFDPILVVVCCAGLGLTLSYLTLGSSRVPCRKNEDDKTREEKKKRRVLIVTAHPDDEVMFFGPTILHFTRSEDALVYLLCLSTVMQCLYCVAPWADYFSNGAYLEDINPLRLRKIIAKEMGVAFSDMMSEGNSPASLKVLKCKVGDYYGGGKVRGQELLESCQLMGLPRGNVMLYRCDDMPDNPSVMWPTVRTANLINQYLHALDINMVVTFDAGGVSGHINHSALYSAIQHLVEEEFLPETCEAYSLDSVNIFRKYSSLLDVPFSYAFSSCAFTLNLKHYSVLQRAMWAHSSQYVWFRKLYMLFSRYLLINTLTRINP